MPNTKDYWTVAPAPAGPASGHFLPLANPAKSDYQKIFGRISGLGRFQYSCSAHRLYTAENNENSHSLSSFE